MRSRKEMKKSARKVVKKHYFFLILVCIISSFIGSEFTSTLSITRANENIIFVQEKKIEKVINEKDLETAKKETTKKKEKLKKSAKSESLGRSRGVFSLVLNSIDSGSIYVTILQTINSVVNSQSAAVNILIILSSCLAFVIWYYFINTFKVISRRIFLESRIYDKDSSQRFLFFIRVKKWNKVAFTTFLTKIFNALWGILFLPIGIVKRYSYYLVSYIVAENPDINALDAITLSRQMMNHHKWECFLLELSFVWWEILGVITLGLSKVFYSNAYKTATLSEYYTELRTIAKETKIVNNELLNDKYLFEKADQELINKTYSTIIKDLKESIPKIKKKKGFFGILENTFGVSLSSEKEAAKLEDYQQKKATYNKYKNAIYRKMYPTKLFPLKKPNTKKLFPTINYLKRYTITNLILFFFIFSFIGWIWEISLHLITNGELVNRGVLHGPWLPIYGTGSLLILILLYKFREHPLHQFNATILLCGVVEYFTAYFLEVMHEGQKWWDYSGYFLNLHGRICAEGLLVFGLGGLALVYVGAPIIDNYLNKINKKVASAICILLVSFFLLDQIYSFVYPNVGNGITNNAYNIIELKIYEK